MHKLVKGCDRLCLVHKQAHILFLGLGLVLTPQSSLFIILLKQSTWCVKRKQPTSESIHAVACLF